MSAPLPLIITYHAIECGPAPLCVEPALLAEHLDVLADAGARPLTLSGFCAARAEARLPPRAVVLTFDDAFASVVESAAPLLARRGWPATVFAVAGHLGARSDWRSQGAAGRPRALAGAEELRGLAAAGWEIGSHGVSHEPLSALSDGAAEMEITRSRALLEHAVGAPVGTFAYPYGAVPGPAGLRAVRRTYRAAGTMRTDRVRVGDDSWLLPRVDAHYLRSPGLLRRVTEGGLDPYLRLRALGSSARRLLRSDYLPPGSASSTRSPLAAER